jgi:acyl carrier protein
MITEREEIIEDVQDAIEDAVNHHPGNYALDSTFQSLKMDSLNVVEVVQYLEDIYNIVIESKEIGALKTVNDLVNLVEIKCLANE